MWLGSLSFHIHHAVSFVMKIIRRDKWIMLSYRKEPVEDVGRQETIKKK